MSETVVPEDGGLRGRVGRSTLLRRYVTGAAVVVGLILVGSTGAAFLATNGTATATVTAAGSSSAGNVYTPDCATSPCTAPSITGITTLDWGATGTTTPQAPGWNATQGQVTQVATAGDLAVVDAAAGETMITVALTNAAAMAGAYTYVNIPVEIYKCAVSSGTCSMALDTTQTPTPDYLSFSNATETFTVAGGSGVYYEAVVPTGGSMYVYNSSSTLAANFLVTSQILG